MKSVEKSNLNSMKKRKYALPPEVSLEVAIEELGFSHFSHRSILDTLVENINKFGLRVKIEDPQYPELSLQLKEHGYEEQVDDVRECVTLFSDGPFVDMADVQSDLVLLKVYRYGRTTLGAVEVEADGKAMYFADPANLCIVRPILDLNTLYIDKEDLEKFSPDPRPSYADPNSEYYAPELALAVRLHEDIRVKNIAHHFTDMQDRITFVMQKHYKIQGNLGSTPLRLRTVIGPRIK